jgi:hypothetical protein
MSGKTMARYTAEQRQEYAEMICELAREWIIDQEADFEVDLQRGVEWRRNASTGDPTPRANPTLTLTLRINGGAQRSEGLPIVPSPPLFRGPEG